MQNPRSYRWAKQSLYRSLQLETHSGIRLNANENLAWVGWSALTQKGADREGSRKAASCSEGEGEAKREGISKRGKEGQYRLPSRKGSL